MQTTMKLQMAKPFVDRTTKHEHFTSVNVTHNYEMFNLMFDNRELSELHLKRLKESFKQHYLVSPIIVNEKMQVIDGQHRLSAARELKLPVYYIIIKNYGIEEVAILNNNQKNWTKMDYLNMYAEEGKEPYKQLRDFMKMFPDFGIQAAERIVTNRASTKMSNVESVQMKDFQEGKLVITDIQKAYKIAAKIMDFKPYYPGFNRRSFVSAVIPLFGYKHYNHKEMIHKMEGPIKIEDRANVSDYREQLEEIFNYRRQKENKVSFKYLQ